SPSTHVQHCRQDTRDYCDGDGKEMVPGASHVTAVLCDAPEQGTLGISDEDPLRQTLTLGDFETARHPVPAQTLPGLEQSPLMQTHVLSCLEMGPVVQTQTLRDFEKHLNDLKKENFSLKLRIYFLEERMQQKYEASREDVYKRNIELKVEVESLKRELQEKQQTLDTAWAAAENLTSRNEAELRRWYEERQQETEHVSELLENKIQLLQEEARLAKSEAERMAALAEAEKGRCLELTKKLKELTKEEEKRGAQVLRDDHCAALAQKDKRIEELIQELSAREQLIELLATEKENLLQRLEEPREMEVQNLPEDHQQLTQCDPMVSGHVSESHTAELQDKIQQYDATNKLLQEKLNEMNFELKSVQEASQRQDRTIQSLNETLKSKESEIEELYHVIEGQNETMAKLRDMLHRSQLGHLQTSEGPYPSQQQHMALLDLQNTLFCTQLEIQKLKRAQRQKEHQLAEAKRATQLLEAAVQDEQQLKEASWKHNQELRSVVQQVQAELQGQAQQLQALEGERCCEIRAQEQRVQRLSQRLAHKEQLLQEPRELLQLWQSSEKSPVVTDAMLEKLQQRIRDRDAALERAIDEKFCAVEEKEQELRQLHLSVREREHDLERLRSVLSSNEATIHSMEGLLKAKTLELEQVSATCQNLQWLKEEVEAKSSCWQKEQEGIIQQLQTSLHDRNKEVEELTATLLCKLGPGQGEIAEELCLRLQRKERMLRDLLSDRNRQAEEHETELRELLQAVSAREQRSRVAAEKMVQALAEKSGEVQFLRQRLVGKEPGKNPAADSRLLLQKDKQPFQVGIVHWIVLSFACCLRTGERSDLQ
ncbi:phosphodiesterase 4D interacting protein-like, partial [Chelydra serpentina]